MSAFDASSTSVSTVATRPVGCDDGHDGIKVCAGPDMFFRLPARAAPGRLKTSALNGETDVSLVYETAPGEHVTITAYDMLSPATDTRSNDYPTNSVNRALVVHAMREAGIAGPVALVTGLPVNRFYLDGERNTELIDAKRESLMRKVQCAKPGIVLPEVRSHKVISEAVAAYYDALLDFNGQYNKAFKDIADEEPVAVVDIGGKTLDIAAMREGGSGIYQAQSGTAEAGVLYLYDLIEKALQKEFGLNEAIPVQRLEKSLKDGTFRLYGGVRDVRDMVEAQREAFADRIAFEVKKLLGEASRFGRVLFVGGGVNLLANMLDRVFPGLPASAITVAPTSDDPRTNAAYANARGMYKAALLDSQTR